MVVIPGEFPGANLPQLFTSPVTLPAPETLPQLLTLPVTFPAIFRVPPAKFLTLVAMEPEIVSAPSDRLVSP